MVAREREVVDVELLKRFSDEELLEIIKERPNGLKSKAALEILVERNQKLKQEVRQRLQDLAK